MDSGGRNGGNPNTRWPASRRRAAIHGGSNPPIVHPAVVDGETKAVGSVLKGAVARCNVLSLWSVGDEPWEAEHCRRGRGVTAAVVGLDGSDTDGTRRRSGRSREEGGAPRSLPLGSQRGPVVEEEAASLILGGWAMELVRVHFPWMNRLD